MVGTRDFVTERLQLRTCSVAHQRMTAAEDGAGLKRTRQWRAGSGERAGGQGCRAGVDASACGVRHAGRAEETAEGVPRAGRRRCERLNRRLQQAQVRFDAMVAQEAVTVAAQAAQGAGGPACVRFSGRAGTCSARRSKLHERKKSSCSLWRVSCASWRSLRERARRLIPDSRFQIRDSRLEKEPLPVQSI